ncbi:hypothetical protein D3C84_1133580 [compost metagenome]
MAWDSSSYSVKRRGRVTGLAFGSGVVKVMPPASRVCSDSLFTSTPDRLPLRVIPLEFQKRVDSFTSLANSGSIWMPITTRC